MVVVYTEHKPQTDDQIEKDGLNKNVTRRIVRGPEIFVPLANEWLHHFSWHGTVVPGREKGSITGFPNDVKVPTHSFSLFLSVSLYLLLSVCLSVCLYLISLMCSLAHHNNFVCLVSPFELLPALRPRLREGRGREVLLRYC